MKLTGKFTAIRRALSRARAAPRMVKKDSRLPSFRISNVL
jgi:hypothetical protein